MTTFEYSTDQENALDVILDWHARPNAQYLTMGGYAGTGKSTLVVQLAEELPGVVTAALCGKAAHVLRAKVAAAQTVHSLIYAPRKGPDGRVQFCRRNTLDAEMLIVDESSMIDHLLLRDLLSFGLPILFVGDHGQLEPIGPNPNLMADPNIRLETIHRQAMGNPILRLATAFREDRPIPLREDPEGRLAVRSRADFDRLVSPDMQIICGRNTTRHKVNSQVRDRRGYSGRLVCPGDTLMCLKNNKRLGIFNGQQVQVLEIEHEGRTAIDLTVRSDEGRTFTVPALKRQFGAERIDDFEDKLVAQMDYGYCLTAHKAQGSEWASVLVLEEISPHWDARRWRYTVATRAKERLIYCR
jgi:exodeoxyribonuclease-5